MAKKKTVSKKVKNSSILTEIRQLHLCIAQDKSKLEKLYKKAFIEISKKMVNANKAMAKGKKAVDQSKKSKKKSPKQQVAMTSLLQSQKKEIALLKAEEVSIKAGYKKFNAQQKAIMLADKNSEKMEQMAAKAKMKAAKSRKKIKKVKKAQTVAPHSELSTTVENMFVE